MPMPHPRSLGTRAGSRDRTRTASLADRLEMTAAEIAHLTALFEPELRRGWIPTEADLRDALGALRSASRNH